MSVHNRQSQRIRQALDQVQQLRAQQSQDRQYAAAVEAVKRFQSLRFAHTYPDLLQHPRYASAARFFLNKLYAASDFRQRDQQFARMAPALGHLLPNSTVETILCLAELHQQTETLDHRMALHWSDIEGTATQRYVHAWRLSSTRHERQQQLSSVLSLGQELDRLVRKPGLAWLLRMMRGPARAAGLAELQAFLEEGFDTFAELKGAREFLAIISARESELIVRLFDPPEGDSVAALEALSLPV